MKTYLEQNDHPVIAVDLIILNDEGKILLTKRNVEPQKDFWSIIGKRAKVEDNSIEHTVKRGAREECGIDVEIKYLVDVLANPRIDPPADPRFYTVQILYVVQMTGGKLRSTEDASDFKWLDLDEALKMDLAFNHKQLLQIYKEAKEKNKLILADRTKFTDNYGKPFNYINNSFPRMAFDNIILNENNEVLLSRRAQWPYAGYWDFPGGYIYVNESVKDCARREAKEEIGAEVEVGDLFHVYSDRGESPKFMSVVAFYFSKIINQDIKFEKNIEMDEFVFFPLNKLPDKVAFHHDRVLNDLKKYLNTKN